MSPDSSQPVSNISLIWLLVSVAIFLLLFVSSALLEMNGKTKKIQINLRVWLLFLPHFNKSLYHYILLLACILSTIIFFGTRINAPALPHYLYFEVAVLAVVGTMSTAAYPNLAKDKTGKRKWTFVGSVNFLILFFAIVGSVLCFPEVKVGLAIGPVVDFIAHAVAFAVTFFGIIGNTFDHKLKILMPSGQALIVVAVASSLISIISSIDSNNQSKVLSDNIKEILTASGTIRDASRASLENLKEIQTGSKDLLDKIDQNDTNVIRSVNAARYYNQRFVDDRFLKSRALIYWLKNRVSKADSLDSVRYVTIVDHESKAKDYITKYDADVTTFKNAATDFKKAQPKNVDSIANLLHNKYAAQFKTLVTEQFKSISNLERIHTILASAEPDSLKMVKIKKLMVKPG